MNEHILYVLFYFQGTFGGEKKSTNYTKQHFSYIYFMETHLTQIIVILGTNTSK